MPDHRSQRISTAIREELAEIIGFELSDPRLAEVDVTSVMFSPGARHAVVKVSMGGGELEQRQGIEVLEHATNYLRHELASRLNLRKVPEIHFELDSHPDVAARVEMLLKRAKKKRAAPENQP